MGDSYTHAMNAVARGLAVEVERLESEVARLTEERDEARRERDHAREMGYVHVDMVEALHARAEEAEADAAILRESLRRMVRLATDGDFCAICGEEFERMGDGGQECPVPFAEQLLDGPLDLRPEDVKKIALAAHRKGDTEGPTRSD